MPSFVNDANGVPIRSGGTPTGDAGAALETRAAVQTAHMSNTTTPHGATAAATANKIALRGASGELKAKQFVLRNAADSANVGTLSNVSDVEVLLDANGYVVITPGIAYNCSITFPAADGAQFISFGGTEASNPGHMYFDIGSLQRTLSGAMFHWRYNTGAGAVLLMTLDAAGTLNIGGSLTIDSGGNAAGASFNAPTLYCSNLADNGGGNIGVNSPLALHPYTVGTLPAPGLPGRIVYATDARKPGEGPGSGSGRSVEDDGTDWFTGDGLLVAS